MVISNYKYKYWFYSIIICTLFFGTNVLYVLGWMTGTSNVSSYQLLLPQFYLAVLLIFFMNKKNVLRKSREELIVVVVLCCMVLFMVILGNTGSMSSIPNGLLLPVLISIIIKHMPRSITKNLRSLLLFFLICNSAMAILERVLNFNFFPFTGSYIITDWVSEDTSFRSTAFQNHPLNNALMTSILMSFVLIDAEISIWKKYAYLLSGFLSLLCFNTRSSIVLWAIVLVCYFVLNLSSRKTSMKQIKPLIIIAFSLVIMTIFYFFITLNWGDRLLNIDVTSDKSALARFEIWSIFDHYSIMDFLFGMSSDEYNNILSIMSFGHVENYWIIFVIRYGLIFTFLFTFAYFKLFKSLLSFYRTRDVIFISIIFLFLSSTNNSLAFNDQVLSVFLLCCYAFMPYLSSRYAYNK
ncbi:VpsF family polysaccharide biosynthesis protein [Flavobacterium sp. 83]|uniref:VpsF family polysaccharide biosynthesis protein n=1 Tax=Flavobacterium sp. 83 TaxID=1131812 RepID=UPI000552C48B|nr:VpsF family polysaccharide biosynthesis protein [Flavobacterium sp. 83]